MNILSIITYNLAYPKDIAARVHLDNEDMQSAITAYEQLTVFDPESRDRQLIRPKYHFELAKLYEEQGLNEKAIKQYELFLEIWKNADSTIPELIEAKRRLSIIKQTATG